MSGLAPPSTTTRSASGASQRITHHAPSPDARGTVCASHAFLGNGDWTPSHPPPFRGGAPGGSALPTRDIVSAGALRILDSDTAARVPSP